MKKKHCTIVIVALLLAIGANAQQAEKFNPEKDKRITKGYTIQLLPAPGSTFGFAISYGKKPVMVQLSNPYMHAPLGYKSKTDAYNVAEWMISEAKNGRLPGSIPPAVAKQLNIAPYMPNTNSSTPKK
jgi:hypothetical protein